MSDTDLAPATLAAEILENNQDISPLFQDVVDHIEKLRMCGLDDEQIRTTVPGIYRIKQASVETGALREPAPDEIRVISLPRKYQRRDWA
jgi:hypothetical protein